MEPADKSYVWERIICLKMTGKQWYRGRGSRGFGDHGPKGGPARPTLLVFVSPNFHNPGHTDALRPGHGLGALVGPVRPW